MIEKEMYEKIFAAFRESGMSEQAAKHAANPSGEPIVRRCEALAHEARQREAAQLGHQREAAQLDAIDTDWQRRERELAFLEAQGLHVADWRAELTHERHLVAWANARGDTTYGATASLNERTPQSTPQRGTTALHERTPQRGAITRLQEGASERDVYENLKQRITRLEGML
jgi:hypothetical protein